MLVLCAFFLNAGPSHTDALSAISLANLVVLYSAPVRLKLPSQCSSDLLSRTSSLSYSPSTSLSEPTITRLNVSQNAARIPRDPVLPHYLTSASSCNNRRRDYALNGRLHCIRQSYHSFQPSPSRMVRLCLPSCAERVYLVWKCPPRSG